MGKDCIQNMVSELRSKFKLCLLSAVRVVLGFQLWVCVSVEPMWFWWYGSNVYQMTMQRLPLLNNSEGILWLGSNLLSRGPQVDSQMTASVQNVLCLQAGFCGMFFCSEYFKQKVLMLTTKRENIFLHQCFLLTLQEKQCLCDLRGLLKQHWSALICLMLGNCLSIAHNFSHNRQQ